MRCRSCSSVNTRVTCTEHFDNLTKRYCRCLDCGKRYRTIERYAVAKPAPLNPKVLRGDRNPNSKLNSSQIKMIRYLHQKGLTNAQIGIRMKVNRSTISRIVNYKTYKEVA